MAEYGGLSSARAVDRLVQDAETHPGFAAARAEAFAKRQPVGIIVGSSTLVGAGAGSGWPRTAFVPRLEDALRVTYNPENPGRPLTVFGNTIYEGNRSGGVEKSTDGLGHQSVKIDAAHPVTWTLPDCTGLWIGVLEGEGVGEVTVSVDGAAPKPVRVDDSGALRFSAQWRSGLLTHGTHTFTVATTGETAVDFVHVFDGDNHSGPILLNGSWGGSTLDWHINGDQGQRTMRARLESINPDFVILMIGSNEEGKSWTAEQVQRNVAGFLSMVGESTSTDPWILLVSQDKPGAELEGWSRFNVIAPLEAAAGEDPEHRDFLRVLEDFWPDATTAQSVLKTLASDGVHPTESGHAALANRLIAGLGLRR